MTWSFVADPWPPAPDLPEAACRQPGVDPLWFFPERGHPDLNRHAVAVCSTCPHQADCAAWALDVPGVLGIWGGTSARSRARARKGRQHGVAPLALNAHDGAMPVDVQTPAPNGTTPIGVTPTADNPEPRNTQADAPPTPNPLRRCGYCGEPITEGPPSKRWCDATCSANGRRKPQPTKTRTPKPRRRTVTAHAVDQGAAALPGVAGVVLALVTGGSQLLEATLIVNGEQVTVAR
jgi:Transcription factor WhiB